MLTTDINQSASKGHSNIHPKVGHKHLQGFEEISAIYHTIFRHLGDLSENITTLSYLGKVSRGITDSLFIHIL